MDTRLEDFRLSMWDELGFTEEQALDLLYARGLDGHFLNHHDVRRYMTTGASHEQVVRIFAPMA